MRIRTALLSFLFLLVYGCAAPLIPGVEIASTLLSLGNIGQTVIKMTTAPKGKVSVGQIPPHYYADRERLLREAWEQNYQLAKVLSWEGEDEPWKEVVAATTRKAGKESIVFALVARTPRRSDTRREEITVYRTISGRVLTDPKLIASEHFYPETHAVDITVPIYTYTAWFFTKSRQISGILASGAPETGPCALLSGQGTLVRAVGAKTPAHTAKLQAGDIITSVNGYPVPFDTFFSRLIAGDNSLAICRNGQSYTTSLKLPAPGKAR
jgi:Trypsin-like serine proteases, typically periplasmic, contain C-terminal PDZ domain